MSGENFQKFWTKATYENSDIVFLRNHVEFATTNGKPSDKSVTKFRKKFFITLQILSVTKLTTLTH